MGELDDITACFIARKYFKNSNLFFIFNLCDTSSDPIKAIVVV